LENLDLNLQIEGMHCDGCVRRVTNALAKLPGVVVNDVKVGSAHVKYDPHSVAPDQIFQAVDKIGFTAHTA
jgi:copper chaperone CopZ